MCRGTNKGQTKRKLKRRKFVLSAFTYLKTGLLSTEYSRCTSAAMEADSYSQLSRAFSQRRLEFGRCYCHALKTVGSETGHDKVVVGHWMGQTTDCDIAVTN